MITNGLYNPRHEHDSCGVGFVANISGTPTHEIVERGITVLTNLLHRGAYAGDEATGDGAGLLMQIPDEFLRDRCAELNMKLPQAGKYGVGMFFFPEEAELIEQCQKIVEEVISKESLDLIGWREVPVEPSAIGESARAEMPAIYQCFIQENGGNRRLHQEDDNAGGRLHNGDGIEQDVLERKLYVIRKLIEKRAQDQLDNELYIPSLSSRTIVYKGMMMGDQLGKFYIDLLDPGTESAVAVVHQRYSTNTFPSWKLAHPFRYLAHNGEINTLSGNLNQMHARKKFLASDLFGADLQKVLPVTDPADSDSANLDSVFELLVACGRDLPHAAMMLMPQAWGPMYPIGPDLRGFFEYHAGLMEPWDGPAATAFTNGLQVGAMLDRNGLRPSRYTITNDGFMVLASEAGVLDFPASQIKEKGSLGPGEMILIDLNKKRVIKDKELKASYARHQPYRRWVEENKITLHGLFNDVAPVAPDTEHLVQRQKLFGYTREDAQMIVGQMASRGHEPVGAMGSDTPLAVLSEKPQLLYNYFKQLFAQVTNPPIDPIREELVMSLMTFMGNRGNILLEIPQNARLIKLTHPILSNEDLQRLKSLTYQDFMTTTLKTGFPAGGSAEELERALSELSEEAEKRAKEGMRFIILSDRDLPEDTVPIPALLAISAVNRHLIRKSLRTSMSILVETGEAREVQHVALLLGYGGTAVNPYLAFDMIADMASRKLLDQDITVTKALENYITALCKGLLKIMSKMGISTLRSYRSAQVFEAIGLNSDLVEKHFTGTSSRIGGIGLTEIAAEANARYEQAQDNSPTPSQILPSGGHYRYRADGERHLWTPESISKLQWATRNNNVSTYREYAELINNQAERQSTLRGLFKFKKAEPVPLEEVEPASEIVKRFASSAMSFGSISRETHETIAIAMNRLGAMSNSGEGGEDPARYKLLPNGDNRCSMVKQVASGRFGVTAEYLVNAREIQIKIAQGAKPGEGGQLPGHKVNAEIARVRYSTPGVTLISPPPHHDIYSIEDIKQLIFDLRNVNPRARISIKLVSRAGVGTVAAGLVKGKADMILISGYDGGTGASPLSSIKHAGMPWEIGLAETQQTLVRNNLRGRVRLQADGQMRTGRDIVIAAMLGAEEFGFATGPLVVCGCVMMRKCNENTCPVGVATQDPELRKRFTGKPEHLVNFFNMIAEDARQHMANLGIRTVDELVGRADLLEMNKAIEFWKAKGLDFSGIFHRVDRQPDTAIRYTCRQNGDLDGILDQLLIKRACRALDDGAIVTIESPVRNTNLSVGTMLSGEIARRYGDKGLADDTIVCEFNGSAGQSFGAFGARGLTLILEGEANDYLGKGLSGAKIIVKPPEGASFDPSANIICGNVPLYGGTSGEAYISGRAGERFAIRNSGVHAVVEGVGDHGCEYMTGGRVVILGETGVNFGAGMSGGLAYIYDPNGALDGRCNLDMVDLELVVAQEDIAELKAMIAAHLENTGSKRAEQILNNWEACLPSFVKVFPMEYRRALGKMMKEDVATEREEVVDG